MAVLKTASSLDQARAKFAEWFDGGMERASNKYVREMQRFSLAIGFLLALLLNVDTLFLARVLWEDPALRTTVAVTAAANAPQIMADFANQTDPTTGDGSIDAVTESISAAEATLETLLELRLPIGWVLQPAPIETSTELSLYVDRLDPRNLWQFWPPNNPDGWLGLWVLKLIGLALTTIALAQGAPFWFDLLRKLTRRNSNE